MKTKFFLLPTILLALSGCNSVKESSNMTGDDSIGKGGSSGEYASDPTFSSGDSGGYAGGDATGSAEGEPYYGEGDAAGEGETGEPAPGEGGETIPSQQTGPKPGQLTCSALDDNKYYDFWKSLGTSTQEGKGLFQSFKEKFAFNTYNRLDLTINNGNNVSVKVKGDTFATKVDNLHKAYLFPQVEQENYTVEISYLDNNNEKQTIEKEVKDGDTIDLENTFTISNNLEIMFVIDATGSMGDEMSYIKSEIDDVIYQVKTANAQANISLAIMVYRDKGDDYVTRYSDFTADITAQQDFLKLQRASGGGDFEEAVNVALDEAINKQWSDTSTKLLFHVADAPAHDKDVQSWNQSALLAARKGIKIISIASSGIDKKTEYFFRSQSLLTSGQYVYLTDDSGIGGSHVEATKEEDLIVEYLNECLIRLINGYFSGTFTEPVSYKQSQQ